MARQRTMWNEAQFRKEFTLCGPSGEVHRVTVIRKSDGQAGTLGYYDNPRVYHSFRIHPEATMSPEAAIERAAPRSTAQVQVTVTFVARLGESGYGDTYAETWRSDTAHDGHAYAGRFLKDMTAEHGEPLLFSMAFTPVPEEAR